MNSWRGGPSNFASRTSEPSVTFSAGKSTTATRRASSGSIAICAWKPQDSSSADNGHVAELRPPRCEHPRGHEAGDRHGASARCGRSPLVVASAGAGVRGLVGRCARGSRVRRPNGACSDLADRRAVLPAKPTSARDHPRRLQQVRVAGRILARRTDCHTRRGCPLPACLNASPRRTAQGSGLFGIAAASTMSSRSRRWTADPTRGRADAAHHAPDPLWLGGQR